jgi:hypothetical protein
MHLNGEAYLPGTETSGKTVRIDAPAPGVRLLTLDQPHRLNAMSGELIRDLHRASTRWPPTTSAGSWCSPGPGGASAPGWT